MEQTCAPKDGHVLFNPFSVAAAADPGWLARAGGAVGRANHGVSAKGMCSIQFLPLMGSPSFFPACAAMCLGMVEFWMQQRGP